LHASGASADAVQRDILLFFAYAMTYTFVNAFAVSLAVALSTQRPLREIWHLNTRGLLGYDVGASVIAIVVAVLFTRTEAAGYGPIGLIGVVVPIVVVRHIYGMYHQLQGSGQELLQVMVKAIEARDPYTSGHSLRVSAFSRAIAVELGLPARQIELVETAALLHDVGKIYEEFAPLLRKEQRLSPEETALMQTHASRSADLVSIISKFRGAVEDAVRHHHERWDGQGYPDGLRGAEIPLGARIILVADTIDAMTTDRPYRKRLGLETVVNELQRCRGTQFDPELVDKVISSVAIRRLITEPNVGAASPMQSRRVPWPKTTRWLVRRA
jgi:putative nucleotidyltransferase with HDIG domain